MRVLVIGDSHAFFWGGRNRLDTSTPIFTGVDVLWVGPATAYNVMSPTSAQQAARKAFEYLDAHRRLYGCILLSFGEIDCRVHIAAQAIRQGRTLPEQVDATVARYLEFAETLRDRYGLPCVAWGPIASSPPEQFAYNPEFPAVGTVQERNYITHLFNAALMRETRRRRDLGAVSIFDDMIDEFSSTKPGTLWDGCHLGAASMKAAESGLRGELGRMNLQHLLPALDRARTVSDTSRERDFALGLTYVTSSRLDGTATQPFRGEPVRPYAFHTNKEYRPCILFDLQTAYVLETVVTLNSLDGQDARTEHLKCSVSLDSINYTDLPRSPVSTRDRVVFDAGSKPIRFLQIFIEAEESLHLSNVQIVGRSFA